MNSSDIFFVSPLSAGFHLRKIGTGFLSSPTGARVGCRFILEQTHNGEIALRCLLDTVQSEEWRSRSHDRPWYLVHEELLFDLVTDDDYQVEILRFHEGSGGIVDNGIRRSYEFSISQLDLIKLHREPPRRNLQFAEFSIVNFKVDKGNASVRYCNLWRWEGDVAVVRSAGHEFWLRALPTARETLKRLEGEKGTEVTATVSLQLNSLEEWDEVEACVDNLCTVLTLLSGNRVSWISGRAIDSYGYSFRTRLRNSVTTGYTKNTILKTLSTREGAPQAMTTSYVPVIELMLSQFDEAKEKWNIRAAINTWQETVISDHFIVQRGLLIAACIEMLRTCYLKHDGRQTILDEEIFQEQIEAIREDLHDLLKSHFPTPDSLNRKKQQSHEFKLRLMSNHVRSLNYFPFRISLEQMAQDLGMMTLAPDDEENTIEERFPMKIRGGTREAVISNKESIRCFVTIRDHLTHQGEYVGIDDYETRSSTLEAWHQFRFLQRFAAALLCSVLGWTQPLPAHINFPATVRE